MNGFLAGIQSISTCGAICFWPMCLHSAVCSTVLSSFFFSWHAMIRNPFFHFSPRSSPLIRLPDSFLCFVVMFCSRRCLSLSSRRRGPPAPWGSGSQSCLSGTGSSRLGSLKGGPTASGWQASSTRRASWQPWDRYARHQATYLLTHRRGGDQMARRGTSGRTATFAHTYAYTHIHTYAQALGGRQAGKCTHISPCFLMNSDWY